jgi:hypothetical protein
VAGAIEKTVRTPGAAGNAHGFGLFEDFLRENPGFLPLPAVTFVQVYEERFERPYGFWRPYLQKVIYRYLDCGDLHHGFARVKCRDCHHEYLLALTLTSYCTSSVRAGTMA